MIEISTTQDVEQLSRALRVLGSRQLPFALAMAATRTAQSVHRAERSAMPIKINRPTQTTLHSLYLTPATKAKPEARVWFKDSWGSGVPADRYMQPMVRGGDRRHKRFERALISQGLMRPDQYAIPRKDVLDSHGNVRGGQIMRILSGLGAAETRAGYMANATKSRRSRRKGNNRFFVAKIGGAEGIWERKASAFGSGVKLWFLFVDQPPTYDVRYPFFEIAEETVRETYAANFSDAIDHALKTARR